MAYFHLQSVERSRCVSGYLEMPISVTEIKLPQIIFGSSLYPQEVMVKTQSKNSFHSCYPPSLTLLCLLGRKHIEVIVYGYVKQQAVRYK